MNTLRAFALVVLAPVLLCGLAAGLVVQAIDTRAQAGALQDRLARAMDRPLAEPVTRGTALLVPGQSAGLASAAFQALVKALTEAAGAELVQVEAAPPDPEPPLSRLHLTVRLRGAEGQIASSLSALETATPMIRIDRLDLQGEGQEAGVLTATLTLSAWAAEVTP